ncbi:hypothetical protein PT169_03675 [Erysipelothrix rhusiopathiae]|uniref:hypothetical protein n=1 Tax=Erysipelothrix sp. P66 TaxID=3141531 RepID=UPI0023AED528|nr:hypothetical protein [Erysipelothrix rhusiopathiae]
MLNLINQKIKELEVERSQYDYSQDEIIVERKEREHQQALNKMLEKKAPYDRITEEIKRLDSIKAYLEQLSNDKGVKPHE